MIKNIPICTSRCTSTFYNLDIFFEKFLEDYTQHEKIPWGICRSVNLAVNT